MAADQREGRERGSSGFSNTQGRETLAAPLFPDPRADIEACLHASVQAKPLGRSLRRLRRLGLLLRQLPSLRARRLRESPLRRLVQPLRGGMGRGRVRAEGFREAV